MEVGKLLETYVLENIEKAKSVEVIEWLDGKIEIIVEYRDGTAYCIEFNARSKKFEVRKHLSVIAKGNYDSNEELKELLKELQLRLYSITLEKAVNVALSLKKQFFSDANIKDYKTYIEVVKDSSVLAKVFCVKEFKRQDYYSAEYLTSYERVLEYLELNMNKIDVNYKDPETILAIYDLVSDLIIALEQNDIDTAVYCTAKLKSIFSKYKKATSYKYLLDILMTKMQILKHELKDTKQFEKIVETHKRFIKVVLKELFGIDVPIF